MSSVSTVLKMIKDQDVKYVSFRFTDPRGKWQHLSYHVHSIDADLLNTGVMFDGSSITGWKDIHESDMLLKPRPETAVRDPFAEYPTLILICDVHEPRTGEHYGRGPRGVAKRAEKYLVESSIGDTAYFGPEAEFFVFDSVRFSVEQNRSFYEIDSEEGALQLGQGVRARQPRAPTAPQGRLLPGCAGRSQHGIARRNACRPLGDGRRRREAPPRGGAEPA